eukprot:336140-Alexandrium_andersonii.AAC.1
MGTTPFARRPVRSSASSPGPARGALLATLVVPICADWTGMRIGRVCGLGASRVESALRVEGGNPE